MRVLTALCFAGTSALRAPRVNAGSPRLAATRLMSKSVLVPIGHGSEEIETTAITDTLVRAGAEVVVASVEDTATVTMSRGLRIVADATIDAVGGRAWDLVACPGGMPGAERLRDSAALDAILRETADRGGLVAAVPHLFAGATRFAAAVGRRKRAQVCAAPAVVLAPKGLLGGAATCYPAPPFEAALPGGAPAPGDVVVDGAVTTSRGPGTSLAFALALVRQLYGAAMADELAAQMLVAA